MDVIDICVVFVVDLDCFFCYSIGFGDLLLDFFKIVVNLKIMMLFVDVVEKVGVVVKCEVMFVGEKINLMEKCVVFYIVFCNCVNMLVIVDGVDVMLDVNVVFVVMGVFVDGI